jgi:hypothetical protein
MTAEFIIHKDRPSEQIAKLLRFIDACLPGKALRVSIEQYRKPRSDAQNHALFGVAYPPLMEHCGLRGADEKDELHEAMCGDYFGWVEYKIMGHRKKRPRRTTTRGEDGKRAVMSTVDFMEFYAFVVKQAADIGCVIPDPDPMWFTKERR